MNQRALLIVVGIGALALWAYSRQQRQSDPATVGDFYSQLVNRLPVAPKPVAEDSSGKWKRAGAGAASGATTGLVAGPYGAAVGAGIGFVGGLLS